MDSPLGATRPNMYVQLQLDLQEVEKGLKSAKESKQTPSKELEAKVEKIAEKVFAKENYTKEKFNEQFEKYPVTKEYIQKFNPKQRIL